MPKPVCVNCQIAYRPDVNGVYVAEMFLRPPQVYKVWHSDMWKCPSCDHQIVAGFADNPITEHYRDDFQGILQRLIESANAGRAVLVYSYERVSDGSNATQDALARGGW